MDNISKAKDLSICIPIFNEEDNIPILIKKIVDVMKSEPNVSHEIIMVDDGSTDNSWNVMLQIKKIYPLVRCLQLKNHAGESAAEDAALKSAHGNILMTMDADLENNPEDIPKFLEGITKFDCVCGNRVGRRKDGFVKEGSSFIANRVRNFVLQDEISDSGCTFRAFKRECFDRIVIYNGFHRFLPVLFKLEGFSVVEISIEPGERLHGKSKYGIWNRMFNSFYDMLAVRWMKSRKLDYDISQEG